MVRIFLCDENKRWQEQESQILHDYAAIIGAEIRISCYDDPRDLLASDGLAPDVLLCDTEFSRLQPEDPDAAEPAGITAVKQINQLFPRCLVIYVTENLDHALDAYRTEHLWFALKEQLAERLPEIVDKYYRIDNERKSNLVIRTTDGITASIPCRDIIYLERRDRKTVIVTHNRRYEVRDRISNIFDMLPRGRFARCHNSFAVNLDKIKEIDSRSVHMRNGAGIIISRGYSKAFREEYHKREESRTVK